MKPIAKFISKKGREIEIWEPSIKRLDSLLDFVNELILEDTFLTLTRKPIKRKDEKVWLKNTLKEIKEKRQELIWAIHNGKIVGSCDVRRGGTRDYHVGTIGLMVRKEYRREGIGKFIFKYILERAKKMNLKIVKLYIFDDNIIAKKMYEKSGFKEFARLPNGFYRRGKYTDALQMYKELLPFK